MFRSFRSRLIAAIALAVFLTTGSLMLMVQKGTTKSLNALQDENARHLLESLRQTVHSQYRSLLSHKQLAMEMREAMLQDITGMAFDAVGRYYAMAASGERDTASAQQAAMDHLRGMRFDEGVGYVWINDLGEPRPRLVMHPVMPELEGQDLTDDRFYCALGRREHLLKAFADVGRTYGEGFVDYYWPKPLAGGVSSDRPKQSHVRLFKPWGWIIGSGVYIDDIEAEAARRRTSILEELADTCRQLSIGTHGQVYLFDGQKRLLVHAGRGEPSVTPAILPAELGAATYRSARTLEYAEPEEDGGAPVQTRAFLDYYEPLDWYLAVSFSTAEIAAPAVRLGRRMILLSIVFFVVGLAVAAVLSGNLVRPLHALVAAAEKVRKEGVGASEVPVAGSLETRELGEALAEMIGSLERVEQSLLDREADLRSTLNSIGDAVVATDVAGVITKMNPVAEKLTGYTEAEALGKPLHACIQIMDAETEQPLPDPVACVREVDGVTTLSSEALLISRDGQRRIVSDRVAPIRDAMGASVGVVLILRDVTEQRQLEERLRQSQKMDSIGQLAGGIAHDFNNMLGGIRGASEMLELALQDNPELMRLVRIIDGASSRASELTQKLLAFSRKGKMISVPVDLHDVARETVALLRRTIDRSVRLECALEARETVVMGDPVQLQSVILNLGVNARDVMPAGGELLISSANVTLDAAYCEQSTFAVAPGEFIEVSVSDTGPGIPPEIMDRVFEPFFTTKEEGKGTGLGLASVYGSVTDHHGEILLESEEGKGSTFRIHLPVAGEAALRERGPRQHAIHGAGRILVIDDEPLVREAAQMMLEGLGYEVETAVDGEDGVERFRHGGRIDLVLLDMVMPKRGGRDTFYALRRIDPDVRILICSGYNRGQSIDALIKDGAIGFVQKPYRREQIGKVIAQALAG